MAGSKKPAHCSSSCQPDVSTDRFTEATGMIVLLQKALYLKLNRDITGKLLALTHLYF